VIASVGGSLAKTSLAAGVDDVVGVGVAARTGESVTHVSHSAQLVVAIFGNEMKITLYARIFRFFTATVLVLIFGTKITLAVTKSYGTER